MKQGDELSPLLFGIFVNALLLALKATVVGHRTISGLRTSARSITDDVVPVVGSGAGLQRLLELVSKFCEWSGMQIKPDKSVITAFDYRARRELDTMEIHYNWKPVSSAANESFPYLGVRASLVQRHIFSAGKELVGITKDHKYLLRPMVPIIQMVASATRCCSSTGAMRNLIISPRSGSRRTERRGT